MKIAIAGPGRCGTTFLTQFFKELGFAVPVGEIHKDARAGLESRIGADSPYEVDKDPWCYEYVDRIPVFELQKYDAFLIPFRNLDDAAMSRSVQERLFRATTLADDNWKWNSFGNVPGGAVSDTSIEGIRLTLLKGLWKLIERLAEAEVHPRFLLFPRLAKDFDYLWNQIGDIVLPRATLDNARQAFMKLSDMWKEPSLTSDASEQNRLAQRELEALVEILRKKAVQFEEAKASMETLQKELAELQNVSDRERRAVNEIKSMKASWSWRLTFPIRRLRSFFEILI